MFARRLPQAARRNAIYGDAILKARDAKFQLQSLIKLDRRVRS